MNANASKAPWTAKGECEHLPLVNAMQMQHELTRRALAYGFSHHPLSVSVCIHIYTYIYIYVHTYTYIHIYKHIHTHIHIDIYRYIYTYNRTIYKSKIPNTYN